MATRVGVFQTHPIQYFSPLWRLLAREPGIELKVHYFSDHSVRGGMDAGFGVAVKWDVPLLEGYEHEFLQRDADPDDLWSIDFPGAKNYLRRHKFDAVFIAGYRCKFERQIARAANSLGIRLVQRGEHCDLTMPGGRGRIKSIVRDVFLRRWYKKLDAICYVGETSRRHFERLNVNPAKLFWSPYAVDTDLIQRQMSHCTRAEARARLGLQDGDVAILFSGKFIDRKDPLLLVSAAAKARSREALVVIFVGSGALEEQIKQQAAAAGLRIITPGFVNQSKLGEFFLAADVFALPSKFETWGLVVNEAMQFGLPVIVTDNMGCRLDLVENKSTGFVIPIGDVSALTKAIDELAPNPSLRREMSAAAKKVVASFNPAAAAKGIARAVLNAPAPSQTHVGLI